MDQLLAIRVFIRIADARSFAKAADSLNIPRSSVSKLLQDLEQHLGTIRSASGTGRGQIHDARPDPRFITAS
ncbi:MULTISPECIES: helix-turn-helix domain-containing protein [Pseudomonas fluorescens group]|uniref:helix-turn-helix domain-containing protein n=1 Tax=Pseudomonas fluorescens group TaxID=136843 RepID=UPI0005BB8354|nr:LysR family transcriptional regulator [Pseudomonas fluorescens]